MRVINLRTPLAHKQINLRSQEAESHCEKLQSAARNRKCRGSFLARVAARAVASHPAPRVAPISGTDLPSKDRASSARGFVGTLRLRSALNCYAKD